MFKKEYLYEFIEKGYEKNGYNLAVTQLIKRMRASGNIDMYEVILNIQRRNTTSVKPSKPSFNYQSFLKNFKNYDRSIIEKADLILKGYKSNIINSALLFGDPGTGKTYFVSQFCKSSGLKCISMDLSSIIDYRFGESIKKLEAFIEENKNKRQVIFFDEADSIFSKRGNLRDVFETSRIITTMLQLLDQERKALIIFSTNLINELDKAIIRRFDLKIDFNKNLNKNLKEKILEDFLLNFEVVLNSNELDQAKRHVLNTNINISDISLIAKRIAISKKISKMSTLDFKKIVSEIIEEIQIYKTSRKNNQGISK